MFFVAGIFFYCGLASRALIITALEKSLFAKTMKRNFCMNLMQQKTIFFGENYECA